MSAQVAAHVRPAVVDDAAAIAAIYRPYVTDSVASFEAEPPDAAEMARRMLVAPLLPWLLAERDGGVVGYCYAAPHHPRAAYRWSVDCSVYLAEEERGRGTGRRLYQPLLSVLADLGYVRVFAGISLPNAASIRLHESVGFTPVGVKHAAGFKHGAWRDVGWWQCRLREPPPDPQEPRAWDPAQTWRSPR